MDNNIHLEKHQLERTVTEQYILCLLDKKQIELADSTGNILTQQENIVRKLVESGLAKQSDLHLLDHHCPHSCIYLGCQCATWLYDQERRNSLYTGNKRTSCPL